MELCMTKNLDLFNLQTAEIFAVLWENFPVPQIFKYEKFNAALPDDYFEQCNSTEMVELMKLRSVVEGTFKFLCENGYIHYETDHQTHFRDVRLTEKSLLVLNMKLESLEGKETIGDNIIKAVKNGTPAVIVGTVTNLFTTAISLMANFVNGS